MRGETRVSGLETYVRTRPVLTLSDPSSSTEKEEEIGFLCDVYKVSNFFLISHN